MILTHILCAVESYRISHDRPGSFGDELIVEGWFLSHGTIARMSVDFPTASFTVEDRTRESEGVWAHHRDKFGDMARRCRFQLIEPLAGATLDLPSAVLLVEMEGGDIHRIGIGRELHVPEERSFSKEEHDLVMQFESMGDNCEFGLVQRKIGSERLSLLRYAGVGDIDALASAIENGFEEMMKPGGIGLTSNGNEWIATAHAARLVFHTGRSVDQISHEKILQEETRKLTFMAQKFIDDCEAATKIFVYRVLPGERGGPFGTRGIDRLFSALSKHGPARLLWVNIADGDNPDGTVKYVRDRLYRGYIDHLAPPWNAFDSRPQSWLQLLRNAKAAMT